MASVLIGGWLRLGLVIGEKLDGRVLLSSRIWKEKMDGLRSTGGLEKMGGLRSTDDLDDGFKQGPGVGGMAFYKRD